MSSSLRPWGHRPVEYSGSVARDWGAGRTVGDGGRYTLSGGNEGKSRAWIPNEDEQGRLEGAVLVLPAEADSCLNGSSGLSSVWLL